MNPTGLNNLKRITMSPQRDRPLNDAEYAFLDGAVVPHPALLMYGESDPSTETQLGIDRQGPALRALKDIFPKLRDIIKMPGVGHTPPEEQPEDTTKLTLAFLNQL